jgi:hypothetical protein
LKETLNSIIAQMEFAGPTGQSTTSCPGLWTIAALLNDLEEPPQFRFGKQLRQLALLLCPAQAQLSAGLLSNV